MHGIELGRRPGNLRALGFIRGPIAEPVNQRGHAVCKSLVGSLFIRRKTSEIRCGKFDRESHWHRFGAADFSCGSNK
jgi:hypothetical protein